MGACLIVIAAVKFYNLASMCWDNLVIGANILLKTRQFMTNKR